MTPEQKLEGNKLIADFLEEIEGYDDHGVWQKLQYDSSWDYLMRAIEKIESLGFPFKIEKNLIHITGMGDCDWYGGMTYDWYGGMTSESKLLASFYGVVEFIKWHKKQIKINNTTLYHSTYISDYKPILEGLIDDFGFTYYHAILEWCKVIDPTKNDRFWQVWLIKKHEKVVGICGLYSLRPGLKNEFWLGWFGIVPAMRNREIGQDALNLMTRYVKAIGGKKIMSYVDKSGKPLNFYYRNGFEKIGTVREYLSENPDLDPKDFESLDDYIIVKNIE